MIDKNGMLMYAEDILPGGKADNIPDSEFPADQLKKGIAIEREHTDNPQIAKEIAKDHLTEDKQYYTKLVNMEAGAYDGKLLNLPDIRQPDDFSCGAAASMSAARYFGYGPDSIEKWKKELGTSKEKSTLPSHIIEYLTSLGLDAEGCQEMSLSDLRECWNKGLPVICPIQEYDIPGKQTSYKYGHYVCVVGLGLGHVVVFDPSIDNVLAGQGTDASPGRMMIRVHDWLKNWHDELEGKKYHRYGIIVSKPRKYMIDEHGSYRDHISELIIKNSMQAIADAEKEGDAKKVAKSMQRWTDEVKRRQMLHHMLVDYNGHYEDRFVTIGGHPEGEKQHVGGTVIKINSEGKIEGGGPPALKGTNVSEAKTTLEKVHESPVNQQGKLESQEMPPKVEISREGKFTPRSERPKTRAERREARRKAGGGKTAKYDPAKDRTGHTLYKIISRMGGISRESAEKFGIKDLMESGLSGLLPKQGGKNLEQIAQQLHSEGHIAIPGYTTEEAESTGAHRSVSAESKRTAADPSEYLIELVKAKAKSLHAELEDEFAKSQKAYYQELENARKAGIDQSEIDATLRRGEADGLSEAEKGDAWEGTEFGKGTEEPIIDDEGNLIPF